MITVKWDGKCYLEAVGHAGYDKAGRDIVCAAVSMLGAMLAEQIAEQEARGMIRKRYIQLEPGEMHLLCEPADAIREKMEYLFESVATGMQMLADQYPQNVVMTAACAAE